MNKNKTEYKDRKKGENKVENAKIQWDSVSENARARSLMSDSNTFIGIRYFESKCLIYWTTITCVASIDRDDETNPNENKNMDFCVIFRRGNSCSFALCVVARYSMVSYGMTWQGISVNVYDKAGSDDFNAMDIFDMKILNKNINLCLWLLMPVFADDVRY